MPTTSYRGETVLLAILLLITWLSLRNQGAVSVQAFALTLWQLTPVLLFGGLWIFAKYRLARRGYLVMTIATWLALAMLLNFHVTLSWLALEPGPDHPLLFGYIPFFALTTGGLGAFAVFVVLTIKQHRNEFD